MIKIENLIYEYERYIDEDNSEIVRAIDGIDLEIEAGEFVAILGHNGSGKSTLAKHLNALLIPNSGSVKINDLITTDEKNVWDIRKTVGMVFQNPDNQIIATIVEEDVAFGLENLGVPPQEIRVRVEKALKEVDMLENQKTQPHMLSGGQKQRVAIAGIIAMEPDCIVMDEPTAMLDPIGRRELIKVIKNLNEKGKTIILITHNMEEAAEAKRVIVMEKGKIIIDSTPKVVFNSVEKMQEIGLDVPQATLISHILQKKGIDFSDNIMNITELLDEIKNKIK